MDFTIIRRAGITQGQFAELVGVTRATVNTWVSGEFRPNAKQRRHVIRAIKLLETAVEEARLPLPADTRHSTVLATFRDALHAVEA
jgi:DNA-binding XRE family transcriptional regulator